MANLTSTLTVRMLDQVSGPARAAAAALLGIGQAARTVGGAGLTGIRGITAGLEAAATRLRTISREMAGLTLPATLFGGMAARQVYEFQRVGNAVQAVAELSVSQRRELERLSTSLSATTTFGAGQIMTSALELARGGMNFTQIMGALRGTLQLAMAGGIDLQRATDISTNILTAMRLPMSTVEEASRSLAHVNDVLAYAANRSNVSIDNLGETFKYVAPIARSFGMDMEQIGAIAMIMGDNGIRGSEAGVALRSAIVRLLRPTSGARAALGRLGMRMEDYVTPGREVTANDIIQSVLANGLNASRLSPELTTALADPTLRGSQTAMIQRLTEILSGAQGADTIDRTRLTEIVGEAFTAAGNQVDLVKFLTDLRARGSRGEGEIVNIFDTRQGARLITALLADLNAKVADIRRGSPGYGERVAETMMAGIVGAWARLKASMTNLANAIADAGVLDMVTAMFGRMTAAINYLAAVNPDLLKLGTAAVALTLALGPLAAALGAIVGLLGALGLRGAAAGAGAGAGAGAVAGGVVAGAARRTLLRRLGLLGLGYAGADAGWRYTGGDVIVRHLLDGPRRGSWEAMDADMQAFRQRAGLDRGRPSVLPPMPLTTPSRDLAEELRGQLEGEMRGGTSAAAGAGQEAGAAYIQAIRDAIQTAAPELRAQLEALLGQLRLNPTISVTPRIDTSGLNGLHADTGVSATGR